MSNFLECIEFYKIPASVLMREVHPLGVVPDNIVMNALAFQVILCKSAFDVCQTLVNAAELHSLITCGVEKVFSSLIERYDILKHVAF